MHAFSMLHETRGRKIVSGVGVVEDRIQLSEIQAYCTLHGVRDTATLTDVLLKMDWEHINGHSQYKESEGRN